MVLWVRVWRGGICNIVVGIGGPNGGGMGKNSRKALISDGLNYIYRCGWCLRLNKASKSLGSFEGKSGH